MSNQDESILKVIGRFKDNYKKKTPKKVKIIDLFLIYIGLTAFTQFLYCQIVGTFPFNSFLAGFFSCIGLFVMAVSLRKQVNVDTTNEFDETPEKAYSGFVMSAIILFFVSMIFMG
jgi:oligosaccharyltransferase complex subunit epsilon